MQDRVVEIAAGCTMRESLAVFGGVYRHSGGFSMGSQPGPGRLEGTFRGTDAEVQTAAERAEEARLIRRMQLMIQVVMQVISHDSSLSVDEASQMVADARKAALAMFPDKALAFDMIFRPRLQRLMRERYRLQ